MITNIKKVSLRDNTEDIKFTNAPIREVFSTWKGRIISEVHNEDGTFVEIEFGHNSVLLGGLQAMMEWYFHLGPKVQIEYFEDSLYKNAPEDYRSKIKQKAGEKSRIITAYNVCYDGAEGGQAVPYLRYKLGYSRDTLIPFRRIPKTTNNFALYMQTYMHPVEYTHPDGTQYIDYYTKKCAIDYKVLFDDNTAIPDNPSEELSGEKTENKDIRALSGFMLNITPDELIEYYRTEKAGEAEFSSFNATILMAGYPAEIELNGQKYNTLTKTWVFSRCNHRDIGHGADGSNSLQYEQLHI